MDIRREKVVHTYGGHVADVLYTGHIIAIVITRRYGTLRGPTSSSCGGLLAPAEAFFALRAKKRAYYAVLAHFWQFVVSSSNLGNC